MSTSDLYMMLGVNPTDTIEDIKRAYRRLVRQYHPDVNPDNPQATHQLTAINLAAAVLCHPVKRQEYDAFMGKQQTDVLRQADEHNTGIFEYTILLSPDEARLGTLHTLRHPMGRRRAPITVSIPAGVASESRLQYALEIRGARDPKNVSLLIIIVDRE